MVKTGEQDHLTQQKIFKAASDVFEEKGFAAARMQEIADRAGINKALLHYYFRTKEQLFRAVFQVLLEKMFEKILSVFMMDVPFEEKIRIYFDEHISILLKNPNLPSFLLSEISREPQLMEGVKRIIDYNKVRDAIVKRHARELKSYGIKKNDIPQLMTTIISMAIFPFVARDVIKVMMREIEGIKNFGLFMQSRKKFAADFVITALKNKKR